MSISISYIYIFMYHDHRLVTSAGHGLHWSHWSRPPQAEMGGVGPEQKHGWQCWWNGDFMGNQCIYIYFFYYHIHIVYIVYIYI